MRLSAALAVAVAVVGLAVLLVPAGPAAAQQQPAWPGRPLRMVIPWPPGQSTDLQGRLVAQMLTMRLGQNVGEMKRTETTQQKVVEAITAGALSEVPGQAEIVA